VTTLVLDASVAAKWALPAADEPFRSEAFALLERYADGEVHLIVPDIFWSECGNILWKAVRQKRLPYAGAELALKAMVLRDFSTVPSREVLSEAFVIALRYAQTVYDCLYVAVAIQSKAQVITANERLANALAAQLPVKWLGAFSFD
jgi:predicted nucleic acid-binding protein